MNQRNSPFFYIYNYKYNVCTTLYTVCAAYCPLHFKCPEIVKLEFTSELVHKIEILNHQHNFIYVQEVV